MSSQGCYHFGCPHSCYGRIFVLSQLTGALCCSSTSVTLLYGAAHRCVDRPHPVFS